MRLLGSQSSFAQWKVKRSSQYHCAGVVTLEQLEAGFCAHHETSDKQLYPTFARTRPPDTQISKSVASLLLSLGWMKVAFLYSTTQDRNFKEVSRTIIKTLDGVGIEVRYLGTWPETYHYGYGENPFDELVENSYLNARILCSSRDFRQTTLPYLCPNQTSGYSNLEVSGFAALKFGLDEGGVFILDYAGQKLQGSLQNNNQDARWSRN
ncbi:ANF_receptor domain-containing protein [Trichonephila inaurata madagascariensis]|uniref:ANF_receptor domain-containing protein n=1 Tax=Trichonephila inaurata madagascariensis TaxID=2747483 RepID=A0A8X6YIN3_9ARAC|nr:ANF_receptor domain-containing protein [Trichonephila inaurata madagascariensis]